jgi:hypothetical protein
MVLLASLACTQPAPREDAAAITVVDQDVAAHPTVAAEPVQRSGVADLFVPLTTLFLVAGAVLAWPSASAAETSYPVSTHLIDGLRDYVARRG